MTSLVLYEVFSVRNTASIDKLMQLIAMNRRPEIIRRKSIRQHLRALCGIPVPMTMVVCVFFFPDGGLVVWLTCMDVFPSSC